MPNNLTLLTDLYQLTMAQAFWRSGKYALEASYYMHFRSNPFDGGYTIACGLAQLAEYIENFAFTSSDIDYLKTIPAAGGTQLFDPAFLDKLSKIELTLNIDAAPEGTAVFPYEPVVRVTGSLMQCQLIETALLNIVGFQTLIATKAARVCNAANGPVAEFGLRRAQGPNGGNLASRAAVIGGCASTSNVMAGKLYGLPVSGTHSHAWVMAFDNELEAFRAFARSFPHNCILLVDTYDTLAGVANAITVAHEMEAGVLGETSGKETDNAKTTPLPHTDAAQACLPEARLTGIRIDSGDLAWLSLRAREMLDNANLSYVKIFASNDLDEYTIQSLITEQGAKIDAWGVGTKLACGYGQPALGGVYKLSATRAPGEQHYTPKIKRSEQIDKSTLPGILGTRRYFDKNGIMAGDMIHADQDESGAAHKGAAVGGADRMAADSADCMAADAADVIIDPFNPLRKKDLSGLAHKELLEPLTRDGKVVAVLPAPLEAREVTLQSLNQLSAASKRLLNPHTYPVGASASLLDQRDALLKQHV